MKKFAFVDASSPVRFKASIHDTGRLVFNEESLNFMNLKSIQHFLVAFDHADGKLNYIGLKKSEKTNTTAKLYRSGPYYYLKIERPLIKCEIDFKEKMIFYIDFSEEKEIDFILTNSKLIK
jgi:hypothetical protein